MGFLGSIWEWFNGNKTKLGALILGIAALLPEGIVLFDTFDLKVALIWLGGILGGVGVAHLVAKKGNVGTS